MTGASLCLHFQGLFTGISRGRTTPRTPRADPYPHRRSGGGPSPLLPAVRSSRVEWFGPRATRSGFVASSAKSDHVMQPRMLIAKSTTTLAATQPDWISAYAAWLFRLQCRHLRRNLGVVCPSTDSCTEDRPSARGLRVAPTPTRNAHTGAHQTSVSSSASHHPFNIYEDTASCIT